MLQVDIDGFRLSDKFPARTAFQNVCILLKVFHFLFQLDCLLLLGLRKARVEKLIFKDRLSRYSNKIYQLILKTRTLKLAVRRRCVMTS